MVQNVLVIGGSGKWSAKVYHPVILSSNINEVKLAAIADPINPRESIHHQKFMALLDLHGTEWLPLCDRLQDDIEQLDRFVERIKIDTLVIVTHPNLNFHYLKWGITRGLDIICEKPPIALAHQFGNPSAAYQLWQDFHDLCDLAKKSIHYSYKRPCKIYIHLRRRCEYPYTSIYQGLQEVYDLTGEGLSYIQIHLNNGCYRFKEEYGLPGAHGYTYGLGTLNHTGYHLIDFAAFCLTKAPPIATYIQSQLISCTLADQIDDLAANVGYSQLIGRSELENSNRVQTSANGEVDINLVFALKCKSNTNPTCELLLALHSRGCTRRTTPYYPLSTTHDEGRVSDTTIILQQGPLQSFHLLLSEDSDFDAQLRLIRRINPIVAKQLDRQSRDVIDMILSCDRSMDFPQKIVKDCLDIFAGKLPSEKLATLSLQSQAASLELYILAISSAFGTSVSWWKNSKLCRANQNKINVQ